MVLIFHSNRKMYCIDKRSIIIYVPVSRILYNLQFLVLQQCKLVEAVQNGYLL